MIDVHSLATFLYESKVLTDDVRHVVTIMAYCLDSL